MLNMNFFCLSLMKMNLSLLGYRRSLRGPGNLLTEGNICYFGNFHIAMCTVYLQFLSTLAIESIMSWFILTIDPAWNAATASKSLNFTYNLQLEGFAQ